MYAWGQFIDHDLDLSRSDGVTSIDIPDTRGRSELSRRLDHRDDPRRHRPGHRNRRRNPATAVNSITGWLDASMVYGSDQATADSLRLATGTCRRRSGDNLPVVNGMFVAGDVRAAENPSLTALQTLFVREHNHQVDACATSIRTGRATISTTRPAPS